MFIIRVVTGAFCLLAGATVLDAATWPGTPAEPDWVDLRAFEAVTAEAGWVWIGEALYWTEDAGENWREIALPLGRAAAAAFADADHGWVVGEDANGAGDPHFALAKTSDGGRSWQTAPLALFEPGEAGAQTSALFLDFVDANTGWLVARQDTSSLFSLGTLFGTHDGGQTWTRLAIPNGSRVHFSDAMTGWIEAGPLDATGYVTADGGRTWALQPVETDPSAAAARAAGLAELSWPSATAGWAKATRGECQDGSCRLSVELRRTTDGGQTWEPLPLPGGWLALERVFAVPLEAAAEQDAGERLVAYEGQGFDTCIIGSLPSLDQMQAWAIHSPYRVRNLYLGGASLPNCGTLTLGYVQALAQQGWLFIPTWVGPQAPCSGYNRKMPNNEAAAYDQGVIEAFLALNTAEGLGLTLADGSGTVLYYDIESYVGDEACRAVVKAFVDGWTATLHATGNKAGVYGSPCRGYLSDFAGITHVPDMVWLAVWMTNPAYDPQASVWNLPCIDNSLWSGGQRIRQYAGDHNETWGDVTLRIDSNVLTATITTVAGGCTPVAGQVAFYVYPHFGGQCVVKNTGNYPTAASIGLPAGSISSVRVGPGVAVRLCREEFHSGLCEEITGNAEQLSLHAIGDNQVASAQVETAALALPEQLWLPLLAHHLPATTPLPNGGFEAGPSAWDTFSAQQQAVIVPAADLPAGVAPYHGSWSAWLGNAHGETAFVQQGVGVPANAPYLAYWQRISSAESRCHYDYVSLWVNGAVIDSYGLCASAVSASWAPRSVDLRSFAGQTVTVRIQVTTDGSLSSSLFLDEVGFQAQP